jgi:hypothetical protein
MGKLAMMISPVGQARLSGSARRRGRRTFGQAEVIGRKGFIPGVLVTPAVSRLRRWMERLRFYEALHIAL